MKTEYRKAARIRPPATILTILCVLSCNSIHADGTTLFPDVDVAAITELDALRGMNGDTRIRVETNQELNATVTGSSFTAGTINGGSVTFAEHALDNFSGIGLFNIVTGNNNAVDSAVGVTFNLQ